MTTLNTIIEEEKKHVAYSPEVNQIRPILVKYFNEYPADLLADLSDLITTRDEAHKKEMEEAYERGRKEGVGEFRNLIYPGTYEWDGGEKAWNEYEERRLTPTKEVTEELPTNH